MKTNFDDKKIAEKYFGKYESHNPIASATYGDCEWCYFASTKADENRLIKLYCDEHKKLEIKGKNRTLELTAENFC